MMTAANALKAKETLQIQKEHLVFDGEIDEVGVHQDLVWGPKLAVILEEKSC